MTGPEDHMRNRIIREAALPLALTEVILDTDGLWARYGCDGPVREKGFEVTHFSDPEVLRRYYREVCIPDRQARRLLVIDRPVFAVPEEIRKDLPVWDAGYYWIFQVLDADALRELPGLDHDRLAAVTGCLPYVIHDREWTLDFCLRRIHEPFFAQEYGLELLEQAAGAAEKAACFRDWIPAAMACGKAAMIEHGGVKVFQYAERQLTRIGETFGRWKRETGPAFTAAPDPERPALPDRILRENGGRTAVILAEGMDFERYYTVRTLLVREPFFYEEDGVFTPAGPLPADGEIRWIRTGSCDDPEEQAGELKRLFRELLSQGYAVRLAGDLPGGDTLQEAVAPLVRIRKAE